MINLRTYGYRETAVDEPNIPGRVIMQQRELYSVMTGFGEAQAALAGSFHRSGAETDFPAVGDFVALRYSESGTSMITKLLPRRSKFSRADFSGHAAGYAKNILEQVVAANFDYVFILTSLNRDFRVNRVMRYLTQARVGNGEPVVILTKADLCEDFSEQLEEIKNAAPGVPVFAVSSHTGFGLDNLSGYLKPEKTLVFLGMSGVGKSSLLNALANEDLMAVKETRREDSSKGSHTTTHRHLFMLPSGTMVIDTPGMRELGLFGADEAISAGFADVEELFLKCRFSNCRHVSEPGCAVLAALGDGTLDRGQWDRYLSQKRENKFVDDRSAYMSEKKAWGKSISKWSKQQRKHGKMKS